MSKVKAWCVKDKETGQLNIGTISIAKWNSKKKLVDAFDELDWADFVFDGYECVQVEIKEVGNE